MGSITPNVTGKTVQNRGLEPGHGSAALHWGLVPKMSGICHKTRPLWRHLHSGGTSGWVVSPRFLPVPWTWICADVRLGELRAHGVMEGPGLARDQTQATERRRGSRSPRPSSPGAQKPHGQAVGRVVPPGAPPSSSPVPLVLESPSLCPSIHGLLQTHHWIWGARIVQE